MSEELRNDAQAICFISMDGVVVFAEHVLEKILPEAIEFAESLSNQAEKFVISALLTATFDDHRRQLFFAPTRQVNSHQLVTGFFELS
jgi:hypothetical protein